GRVSRSAVLVNKTRQVGKRKYRQEKLEGGWGGFQVLELRPELLPLFAELGPLAGQDGLILHPVFPFFHQDRPPFVVLVEFLARQLPVTGLDPVIAGGDRCL